MILDVQRRGAKYGAVKGLGGGGVINGYGHCVYFVTKCNTNDKSAALYVLHFTFMNLVGAAASHDTTVTFDRVFSIL